MDYEKKYKEALERAKKELGVCGSQDCDAAKQIFRLFPELKESKDERIRKELIDAIRGLWINDALPMPLSVKRKDEWLAWLEKQGEHKPIDKIQLGKKYKCIASPRYSAFMIGEIYKPEDKFLCNLMNFCYDCFEPIKDGEQKPTDKIEPKFKVGDWIVSKTSNLVYRVDSILFPQSKCYYLSHNGGIVLVNFADEQNYRLWTIQDAEDGDVLVDEYGIYIFNSFDSLDDKLFICKCAYEYSKKVLEIGGMLCSKTGVKPPTKEQRDLLFRKMKEAGYEWDAEKKELKKIENKNPLLSDFFKAEYERGKADAQKSSWSEEDEKTMSELLSLLLINYPDVWKTFGNWFKTLKDKVHSKQEWSEEDDIYIGNIILAVEKQYPIAAKEIVNWLKSLKNRINNF